MKTIPPSLTGLLFLLASGCSPMNQDKLDQEDLDTEASNTQVLWVAGHKVDCIGVAPMHCMLVSHSDSLAEAEWKMMYDGIQGFDFEPGYYQKLLVRIEDLAPELVPADASSKRTSLVKRLEKKIDTTPRVDGHWTVQTIESKAIETANAPYLEIDSQEMAVNGNDSCNQYLGKLLQLDQDSIQFGPQASTRKMCEDMGTADSFAQALLATRSFQRDGDDNLRFLNEQKQVVLEFRRTMGNPRLNSQ